MSGEIDLSGRVVLVTGASQGIGLAMSRAFHARGARVAMTARGAENLIRAAEEVGGECLAVPTDVSDPVSVNHCVERVVSEWGRIDVLVNNAAVGRLAKISEISDEDLQDQLAINVAGPIYCTRAVVPHFRRGGVGGDIVNVSSDSVERPFPYLGVYGATKASLETLSGALRRELAGEDVRVTLLRSGPTFSNFASGWDPEVAGEAFEAWNAGGFIDPESVIDPVLIADAAVYAVTRPRSASVYTVDVRPRRKDGGGS